MAFPEVEHRTGAMASVPSIGVGYVPAYQVSGDPYFRTLAVTSSAHTVINFPSVTRFVQVINYRSASAIRIGVTENAVNGTDPDASYFLLSGAAINAEPTTWGPFDIKTKTIMFRVVAPLNPGYVDIGIFAGLTPIPAKNMYLHSSSEGWVGVG
jgi:hypothetical protein